MALPWVERRRKAMADFCYQCVEYLYGADVAPKNDFAEEESTPEYLRAVLCEGCGFTLVDSEGRCQHLRGHDVVATGESEARP
jgi:hypothetical protein